MTGDVVRATLGVGFYLGPSYCFLVLMQSPVSGLASLVNKHKLDNMPRSPEAVLTRRFLGLCTGISIAIFSRFVMVPRPLAPARAMRSRICADVVQPCSL